MAAGLASLGLDAAFCSAGCHFQLNRGQIEIPLISCKLFARRANCTKGQCFLASGLRAGRADSSVPSLFPVSIEVDHHAHPSPDCHQ